MAQANITRTMTINTILSSFPQKAQKLSQEITDAGLHCVGCQASTWETLEAGMLGHGYSEEEIDQLVDNLNAILKQESNPGTIQLTKRAADKLLEIFNEEKKIGWGLRFGYKAAGCSGFQYDLDFSKQAKASDQVFKSHGVEIHVDSGMIGQLIGSEIDYVESLNNSGFKVSNPKAKASCGCGSSQSF